MNAKKIMAAALGGVALLTFTVSPTFAAEHKAVKNEVVAQKKVDVTGDGKADVVKLLGEKTWDDAFVRYLVVVDKAHKKTMKFKPATGGFPEWSFMDYNGDKVKDIRLELYDDEIIHEGQLAAYHLTAKNGKIKEILGPPGD
ncbi:hypothetical protein [Salinithrix halophila]|uniref:Uncharacterized protein n=1 Tax=Salinithrix halophila TaxID=1485204 RepID=A0ABV8JFL0_9BACL